MFELLIGLTTALMCIAGATCIIKNIALRIMSPKKTDKRLYAVMLEGKDADIELQMAIETVNWDFVLGRTAFYAVDCGLPYDTAEKCRRMCRNCAVKYLTAEEFYGCKDT